jgi:hypothetical protein
VRRVGRIYSDQYLIRLTLVKELDGQVRPVTIKEEQPPVPLRFGPCLAVEKVHQPVKTKLVVSLSIRRGGEEGEVFFFADTLQPSILDGVWLTLVDQTW